MTPAFITPKIIAYVVIDIPIFHVHQDPVKQYSTSSVDYFGRTMLSSSLSANAKIQACAKKCVEEAKCLSFSYKSYCYLYVWGVDQLVLGLILLLPCLFSWFGQYHIKLVYACVGRMVNIYLYAMFESNEKQREWFSTCTITDTGTLPPIWSVVNPAPASVTPLAIRTTRGLGAWMPRPVTTTKLSW